MKMLSFAAAAMVALTGLAPVAMSSPAAAQRHVVTRTTVTQTSHTGPRDRWRWHNRRVCRVHYRNHHRVRVCRTVRTRTRY